MIWKRRIPGILAIIGLFLVMTANVTSRPRRAQTLRAGTWGGLHIRIDVSGGSATVEYDCANGTIKGPLKFDRSGRFTWEGEHFREHAGPVRRDQTPQGGPAIYSGSVQGDTMTLKVKLKDSDESLGQFTLKRGSAGRVFKCR